MVLAGGPWPSVGSPCASWAAGIAFEACREVCEERDLSGGEGRVELVHVAVGVVGEQVVRAGDEPDLWRSVGLERAADAELGRWAHQRRPRELVADHRGLRRVGHWALRAPDRQRLWEPGGVVAAVEGVVPFAAAEVLDRQRGCGPLHDVRVGVDPPLGPRQIGGEVSRPAADYQRPFQSLGGRQAGEVPGEVDESDAAVLLDEAAPVGVRVEDDHLFAGAGEHGGDGSRRDHLAGRRQRQPGRGFAGGGGAQRRPGVAVDVQSGERLKAGLERPVAVVDRGV